MPEHMETPVSGNVIQFINMVLPGSAGWIDKFDEQTFLPLTCAWPSQLCDSYATYLIYRPSLLAYGGAVNSNTGAGVYSVFKRPYGGYTLYHTRIAL